tara:strand:+ start:14 stop:232 length:219 start_codon:yes stop_codon:yes gene_type:complete
MLGTETLHNHPIRLTKFAINAIREWLEEYDELENVVHRAAEGNAYWLHRLGFKLFDYNDDYLGFRMEAGEYV